MFLYTGGVRAFKQKRTLLRSRTLRLTLRFRCKHLRFAISSLCSFRLPPGTPKNNRNRGCFCIRGSPCVLIKTHTASQSNPPAGASLSMQASSLRYFVALLLSTPPGYTKKQPQPRLFLYMGGRTLRLTASEERSKRLHLRKSNAADIANNRTQSVKCKALARKRGC